MARAHSIYLVRSHLGTVEVAFTVKHEAKSWLGKRTLNGSYLGRTVQTIPDGGGQPKASVWAEEFCA